MLEHLDDAALVSKPLEEMDEDELASIHGAALNALCSDSPRVLEFTAEQSKGAYGIEIQGVPGVYIVRALEWDDSGPFHTLAEAIGYVKLEHGEFLINSETKPEGD